MTCPACKDAEQQPDLDVWGNACTSCFARAFALVGADLPVAASPEAVDLWKRWRGVIRQKSAASTAKETSHGHARNSADSRSS